MKYIGICSDSTSEAMINSGSITECLESLTVKYAVAKSDFRFDTLADFKDKVKWKEAIASRDIIVVYDAYEVADANTEAVFYETGNFKFQTTKEIKKMTCESYLSICSHGELKKIQNSDYTQIFEFTENSEVIAIYDLDDIKIKGQDMTDFDVGMRGRTTSAKAPFTLITITFKDFNQLEDRGVIDKFTWDILDLNGIFGLKLELISATDSLVKFKALMSCGNKTYDKLVDADVVFPKDSDGTAQPLALTVDSSGVYSAVGTTLVAGVLSTDGVIDKTVMMLQSDNLEVAI